MEKTKRYVASVSFGKDSLAMLYRLIDDGWPLDEVVYFNNGMEFQAIYDTRDKVLAYLAERSIKYTELAPKNPFIYDMLERPIKYRNKPGYHIGYGWCGGPCRWGTSEKLRAIRSHCGDATIYVGLAADEPQRFDKCGYPNRCLPLVSWGMDEAACLSYCYKLGFDWMEYGGPAPIPLYEFLGRVSCWCCCNKNLQELKHIYLYLPQYWERLKGLQLHLCQPMKGYYNGHPRGIFELETRFENEFWETQQNIRLEKQVSPRRHKSRQHER